MANTQGPQTTVLILDDELELLELIEDYLTHAGFRVHATANPDEAWAKLQDASLAFHAFVCDIQMPNQSGTAFLSRLQTSGISIPTILMTGHFDVDYAAAKRMGATDAIVKPFDLAQLRDVIKKNLSKKHDATSESDRASKAG